MSSDPNEREFSRRDVLRASGGVAGLSGTARVGRGPSLFSQDCPDATREPKMIDCDSATKAGCSDDHPRTKELRDEVATALDDDFATVGALLDDGFIPYFDLLNEGDSGGWSHWLNPAYISDDSLLDASRPASIMVDNKWWRPLGVMFIATENGEPADPPSVYGDDEDDEERCSPWHHHVGLPGRYAWWKYQTLYAGGADSGFKLPCRTPCMMHVWTYPNPHGVYAHGPPPRGQRGGPPAEPAGFETEYTPGEDILGIDVVAEELLEHAAATLSRR